MNRYRIMEDVDWLPQMLPHGLEARARFVGEVNNEIRGEHEWSDQCMNQEIYARVTIAIAHECRRVRGRIFMGKRGPDVAFLTVLQEGNFPALERAGADVLGAIETHMVVLQQIPPLADKETMTLWATATARVILNHWPVEKKVGHLPDDPDAITRWEEDGGLSPS